MNLEIRIKMSVNKKSITILAICLLVIVGTRTANAQKNKLHFGLKGAMNISGLSDMKLADTEQKIRMSFGAGLFFNQELNSKNSLHIEALYNSQGAEVRTEGNPFEVYRMDYLALPVYFRHHFRENSSFSLQIGVQPSYLISGKVKLIGGDDGVHDFNEYFATKGKDVQLNNFDFGVSAGFGFGFGKFSSITLTYTRGLLGVFKGNDAPDAKNYLFQMGLCIPLTSNTY